MKFSFYVFTTFVTCLQLLQHVSLTSQVVDWVATDCVYYISSLVIFYFVHVHKCVVQNMCIPSYMYINW